MKKLGIILLMLFVTVFLMVGCGGEEPVGGDNGDGSGSNGGSNDVGNNDVGGGNEVENGTEATPEVVPSFEELLAINAYSEVFKTHETVYFKNICTSVNPDESYVEDALLMRGDGKIDYHMRNTMTVDGSITQDLSRIGNEWFYYSTIESSYVILELGEVYGLDYTLPDILNGIAIGKPYIDGDYIVQHAYFIYEGFEGSDARRRDFTFYFDKETKLVDKTTATLYDNQHTVIATYVTEVTYDVKVEDVFEVTAFDKAHNSEDRIDVEIVVGYNTAEEKKYSIVGFADASICAVINGETYLTYTDPECQNVVATLEGFAGEKSVTLYAKKLEFDNN